MKVLIADPIADAGVEILRKYAEVDIQKALPPEQLQAISFTPGTVAGHHRGL